MKTPVRTILALALLAVASAACSTATGADAPSAPTTPSAPPSQPAQPSVAPSEEADPRERVIVGTITVAEMAFSGPGESIAEAIAEGTDVADLPSLVNGVLFRDVDGTVYLASGVGDPDAPTFDEPMLEVLNIDNDGPGWDLANAELLGLEEADGIVFKRDAQVLGFIEVR